MFTPFKSAILAAFAIAGTTLSAHAAIVACPLNQATRTISNLPAGWNTASQTSPVTDYKVVDGGGQQKLVCVYGAAGQVVRLAPAGQNCTKIPGRRFNCQGLPPPPPPQPPGPGMVSNGPIQLVDNGTAELDNGGQPDMRLDASNPFLRLVVPLNGTQFSPQGTAKPTVANCIAAPYSSNAIPQTQLPVGVWMCVKTSDGNVGRVQITNIAGIPGLPLPMTIFMDHTTWSPAGPGPGPGPGPAIVSAKTIAVQQTFSFNLENGIIGAGPGADVWFQAVNAFQMFLVPINGAQFAVGDRSDRGYNGCSSENYSTTKVALNTVPPGSFVCVITNNGRVSQFRLTAVSPGSPKTLTIKYVTWQ